MWCSLLSKFKSLDPMHLSRKPVLVDTLQFYYIIGIFLAFNSACLLCIQYLHYYQTFVMKTLGKGVAGRHCWVGLFCLNRAQNQDTCLRQFLCFYNNHQTLMSVAGRPKLPKKLEDTIRKILYRNGCANVSAYHDVFYEVPSEEDFRYIAKTMQGWQVLLPALGIFLQTGKDINTSFTSPEQRR